MTQALLGPYRTPADLAERSARRLVPAPRAAKLLARLVVGTLAVTAVALAVVPWQQTASGTGRVVAYHPVERRQTIDAPVEGRIVRFHVREGSVVRRGDPIADLSDTDPEILGRLREERAAVGERLSAVRARIASIESRIGALETSREAALDAAASRVRMAEERTRAAVEALSATETAEQTAGLQRDRQSSLAVEGLAAARTAELAHLDVVRARTEAERARASLRAAQSEELALRADRERARSDARAAIDDARASRELAVAEAASTSAELARIDVRLARQSAQSVTAPSDGTILRLTTPGAGGGELVKAGDPIAVLVPSTNERAVELWLDGNDVPLVEVGREVRLQFEGWPAVQFSGWPSVAVGTFGGRVALVDSTDDGRGKFRVLVVPDGRQPWPGARYLRQGVRANGWVLLSQVPLGYELWRRFNGFPPAVADVEPGTEGAGAK